MNKDQILKGKYNVNVPSKEMVYILCVLAKFIKLQDKNISKMCFDFE